MLKKRKSQYRLPKDIREFSILEKDEKDVREDKETTGLTYKILSEEF